MANKCEKIINQKTYDNIIKIYDWLKEKKEEDVLNDKKQRHFDILTIAESIGMNEKQVSSGTDIMALKKNPYIKKNVLKFTEKTNEFKLRYSIKLIT